MVDLCRWRVGAAFVFLLTVFILGSPPPAAAIDAGATISPQGNCDGQEASRKPTSIDYSTGTVACYGVSTSPLSFSYDGRNGESCLYIDNFDDAGKNSFFVPLKSEAEWLAFKQSTVSGELMGKVQLGYGCPETIVEDGCGGSAQLTFGRHAVEYRISSGASYRTYRCAATAGCGTWNVVAESGTCTPRTDGVCGPAHDQEAAEAPTVGLCASGTPTPVAGAGPWSWSCQSGDSGDAALCATKVATCDGGLQCSACVAEDDFFVIYGREKYEPNSWTERGILMNTRLVGSELVKADVLDNDVLPAGGDVISFTQPVLVNTRDDDPGIVKYAGRGVFRYKESKPWEEGDNWFWNKRGTFTYTVTGGCSATVHFVLHMQPSPLVLDLDGDGFEVIDLPDSKAQFDMTLDGKPDHVAWIGPRDAFLAHDLDGNGRIDRRSELFGDLDGHDNGFAHLAMLDADGDGQMSPADAAWTSLRLWLDADGDGTSQNGELAPLSSHGIVSISLRAKEVKTILNNQLATHESTFRKRDGASLPVIDLWFQMD